jgi:iron(III) transport system substrate-binding protein
MNRPRRSESGKAATGLLVTAVVVGVFLLAYAVVWRRTSDPLVVYCAHDSVYSDAVLRDFESSTGVAVAPKYDTEATKSLGLVELLIREKERPRCDVFWNNELLGTLQLQAEGVLQSYKGRGYERIPQAFKDPDGHWVGFGARLRVYIVNTDRLDPTERAVGQTLDGDLSRVAIAKPIYGTTLTHYTVLWDLLGESGLKEWHADLRERGVLEATGNAHVKNLVAQGTCDLGFTDTDDYFVARDEGRPVAVLPIRLPDGSTICIPNTVCIIKGTRRPGDAQRLVDYLLSAECELALARSKSRQIPLGPADEAGLPPEVRELKEWAAAGVRLAGLGPARTACLTWLKQEYVQ